MTVRSATVAEVIGRYIGGLPGEERVGLQQELSRFMRWFGPDQSIESVDARALESYQEQVAKSGANQTRRLEPLRNFLLFSQKEGYLDGNIAKFIKLKRSATSRRDAAKAQAMMKEVTQLTSEGHVKLKAELDRLLTVERPKVSQELWEARLDKDIRENAPYDAAKQHQAFVEARIRELEHILATVAIIEAGKDGRIDVGSSVVLRDLTHDEELRYTLVGPQEANPRAGKISIASPVGKALLDRPVGSEIEVEAPAGMVRYRIEQIGS